MRLCRDLGTFATLGKFVREYIDGKFKGANRLLATLSKRYSDAAKELGLPHVPHVFDLKHGRLTGTHYRTMARVIETIMCDYTEDCPDLIHLVHHTVTWYWAAHAPSFTNESLVELRELGVTMCDAWIQMDTPEFRASLRKDHDMPKGPIVDIPKFHRALNHLPDYIRKFGPAADLTTETSEAAHKPLKQMFRTYVRLMFAAHA